MNNIEKLPPENECGCAEYKFKIDSKYLKKNKKRFEQLKTQLLYRINEGCGYCIYFLGVKDNGEISNITMDEINESEKNLLQLISSLNLTLINKVNITSESNARSYVICNYN
tara:strand:- start:304 stop:639 length:336 start_codon:yes stop_codon:yes gene_type:complete